MVSLLTGGCRAAAEAQIRLSHYTHSVPSGKSYYVKCDDALVVWSIPANYNLANFVLGWKGSLWELSRLWAPDGHRPSLLTEAISEALSALRQQERVDAVVSYADPNAGHLGGVYRAASWIYHGQSEESRVYVSKETGEHVSRRAFHSGNRGMTKAEIEALGYAQVKLPGKQRFVRPVSQRARKKLGALR